VISDMTRHAGCEVCGLKFFGSPWTLPIKGKSDWAFQARDLPGEDGIGKYTELIPRDVDVLVTHSPPFGQGDEPAQSGTKYRAGHGGSRVLLERVLEVQPIIHVFGHFHEGHGITTHEDTSTLFVNAAICDGGLPCPSALFLPRFPPNLIPCTLADWHARSLTYRGLPS